MEDIVRSIRELPRFKKSCADKKFYGLVGAGKSAVISALQEDLKKIMVIVQSTEEAQWLIQEIKMFSPGIQTGIFPNPDSLPHESSSSEVIGERLSILNDLKENKEIVAIAPLRAILYKTDADFGKKIRLKLGQTAKLNDLAEDLISFGYKRLTVVGEQGEFSVRGGIIDIFPSNHAWPLRIELMGDEIESMRSFDPVTQRSKASIDSAVVLRNVETRQKNPLELIPADTSIIFDDENILKAAADRFIKDISISAETRNDWSSFSDVLVLALRLNKIGFSSFVEPGREPLFESPPDFPRRVPKRKIRAAEGVGADIRADLNVGDHVVHEDYGVGIYRGLKKIEEGEFILIEFADEDKLYVPPNLMGRVEKYVSPEGYKPKLSRMGGAGWRTLKAKVKKSVKDLTKDLLELYSQRKKAQKDPYPPDDAWQRELEDSFPYEETDDQLKAIADVKNDLQSEIPMDRLLCGDVGYGKTEVALRAIVKAAGAGRQVAALVPTTILAEQHYHYFKERLSAFPFKIASLSRFRSKEEQKEIVEKIKTGELDIVVGTHRLLQKDIVFSDLGLLIIDEEHRFGVAQKEKLKKLKKNVDVLSMTATPIPRTLYMSLSGARDLSLIQTPPKDRSFVRTYVTPFNETLVREAILREIDRGGQIFFVHNRIETIEGISSSLKRIAPEAKAVVAHGRMRENRLEKIMDEFLNREHDVLICTAIIESGLDMPNVNTILINNADKLGLAQLYQLRGRVGRSPVKAYAYLLYNPEEVATQSALSRLKAVQEFTSLGSGYKLALRDLEIRGSGNLLGAEQHGHMLAVGFDLYCELLEEAVSEIKGIKKPAPREIKIEIKEDARIPSEYIEDEQQRIAVYRRLYLISDKKEINSLEEELRDRFGEIPKECFKLFDVVRLKIKAQKEGAKPVIISRAGP